MHKALRPGGGSPATRPSWPASAGSPFDARPDEHTWTIREVVPHVGHVTAYPQMMGRMA